MKCVPIIMGSKGDLNYAREIGKRLKGVEPVYRIASAHKTTKFALDLMAELDAAGDVLAYIPVAGRSNGLGPVVAGNTRKPVVTSPPLGEDMGAFFLDLPSSLRMPSDLPLVTAVGPEAAADFVNGIAKLCQGDKIPVAFGVIPRVYADAVEKKLQGLSVVPVDPLSMVQGEQRVGIIFGNPAEYTPPFKYPTIFCFEEMKELLYAGITHPEVIMDKTIKGKCFVMEPRNAALAAANIAALKDPALRGRLDEYYRKVQKDIMEADRELRGVE
jgi:phosphoribosylaminoimidazole carboxylase PurE protein